MQPAQTTNRDGQFRFTVQDFYSRKCWSFWANKVDDPATGAQTFGALKRQMSPLLAIRPAFIRFCGVSEYDPEDAASLTTLQPVDLERPLLAGEQFADLKLCASICHPYLSAEEPGIRVHVVGSQQNSRYSVRFYPKPETTVAEIIADFGDYGCRAGQTNTVVHVVLGEGIHGRRVNGMCDSMTVREIRRHMGRDTD